MDHKLSATGKDISAAKSGQHYSILLMMTLIGVSAPLGRLMARFPRGVGIVPGESLAMRRLPLAAVEDLELVAGIGGEEGGDVAEALGEGGGGE